MRLPKEWNMKKEKVDLLYGNGDSQKDLDLDAYLKQPQVQEELHKEYETYLNEGLRELFEELDREKGNDETDHVAGTEEAQS